MFSILKRNWVDLFCYTNNRAAYEYFPIAPANNFIPYWWNKIPNNIIEPGYENDIKSDSIKQVTMKRCPGIIEYYKKGFMLPLWSDLEFVIDKGNIRASIACGIDENGCDSHPNFQRGQFLTKEVWEHIKISSPWRLSTDKKIDFMYLQPHWNLNNLNKNILIPNGTIDFFFQNGTEIQLFLNRQYDGVVSINAGMPLIHLVPLTDKKIKVHNIYDKIEHKNYDNNDISFIGDYYRKVNEYKKRFAHDKK